MKRRTLLQYMGAATTVALGSGLGTRNAFGASVRLAEGLQTTPATVLEGIYFNQLGYQPGRAKVASLAGKGIEQSFRVLSAETGTVVLEGKLGAPTVDAASGDTVRLADLSAVKTAGIYRIEVGGAVSDRFPVRQDVYAGALRSAMRSFYGQRCGCTVDLGNGYKHATCHGDGAYHASSGKTGKAPSSGGWHDAGDYGRYVVNSGITCGTLLWAWEMYPDALHRLALDLPESGKGTPDYLAEVRWNLEWMLSLQDTDGGVFHKQTSEHFCGFVMPEKDTLPSYMIGTGQQPYKSTCATADLAAVMAIAARCYKPFDPRFARHCLDAARKGYAWAAAHPEAIFTNPTGISTGEYGDMGCADELLWAAAELWRTTGEAAFEQAFLTALPKAMPAPRHDETAAVAKSTSTGADMGIDAPSWSNVRSLGCWSFAMADHKGSAAGAAAKQEIVKATLERAEQFAGRAASSGYGNTLAPHDYIWGSNSVAANQSLLLLVADRISGGHTYTETALNNLHYLIGRNCLGVSWVTQVGTRPVLHPHHRPSIADGIDKPWPGLLSGGPNPGRGDEVANKLPQTPPMRVWIDDEQAYSVNEIAINWNAPLVFLLAAANAPRS